MHWLWSLTRTALTDPRFRRHWQALLVAMMIITCWFAFTPHPPGFEYKDADKVNHLLAFSSMTLVGCLGRPDRFSQRLTVAAMMILFGLFIEAVQSQLPARSAELADVLADTLGITLGFAGLWMLRRLVPGRNSS